MTGNFLTQVTNRLQVWREVFAPAHGDGQTAEDSKEGWRERVGCPCSECEAIEMCNSRCGTAESLIDFTEGHQFIETKEAYSICAGSVPKYGERTQEDTLAKERWALSEPLELRTSSRMTCAYIESHGEEVLGSKDSESKF